MIKPEAAYEARRWRLKADLSLVQVRFVTNTNAAMPWHFGAKQGGMAVNPGGVNVAMFYAENPTNRPMVAQTIPSIAPGAQRLISTRRNAFASISRC